VPRRRLPHILSVNKSCGEVNDSCKQRLDHVDEPLSMWSQIKALEGISIIEREHGCYVE
jgi:hypothetical protein